MAEDSKIIRPGQKKVVIALVPNVAGQFDMQISGEGLTDVPSLQHHEIIGILLNAIGNLHVQIVQREQEALTRGAGAMPPPMQQLDLSKMRQ